ncbi:hypothetical protein KGF57_004875 [Candida theae]|uniref:GH16 domain-containing protein n=1 Tax=Candida theae TaxID=1198502 RepID=A0AAD5FWF2_9ASCO|nr:uncharacterized protein KGF57_004875 [Candida theae]KAI5949045.1 hypothetical protein KGF57_004875 [Candida theae]
MFSIAFLITCCLIFDKALSVDAGNGGTNYLSGNSSSDTMIDSLSDDGLGDDLMSEYYCPVVCNPNADKFCLVNNVALGTSIYEPFSNGSKHFSITSSRKGINFKDDGMQLTIKNKFENPALTSNFYIMYGKVEAQIKGAFGSGIVSSIYLQSDDLDEIDIAEILGGDPFDYQTNYFIKGNVTTYDRERYHKLQISPLKEYYKYGVMWTPSKIVWYLDDQPVRQLRRENKQGFPTSPMAIKISLWAGEDTENEGTIAWSKGLTNYQDGPFTMNVRNLKVSDYSTGDTYSYGWLPNGEWVDLVAKNGEIFKEGLKDEEGDVVPGEPQLLIPPPSDYTEDFTVPKERHGDWTVPHERVWSPSWSAPSTKLSDYATITNESEKQYEPDFSGRHPIEFAFPTLPVDQVKHKEVVTPTPTVKPDGGKLALITESWFATTSVMSTEFHFTTLIHNAKPTRQVKTEKPKSEKSQPEYHKTEKPKSKDSKSKFITDSTSTRTSSSPKSARVIKSTTSAVQTNFIQFPEEEKHHNRHHRHHHSHQHHKGPDYGLDSSGHRIHSGVGNRFTVSALVIILVELVVLITSL